MLKLDSELFDIVEDKAKLSPRLRMHYDLRTQASESGWTDYSQRMLNVMRRDTVIPIHRHNETNEVVIVLRGSGDEVIYDAQGNEIERVTMKANSDCSGVVVPRSAWHTFIPLEDGTAIFEAKDRPYDPIATEEFLKQES